MALAASDQHQSGRVVGSALAWNLGNQLLTQLVSLGVFLVLARQLTPAAFGVFALALLFVEAFATEARSALVDVLLMRRNFDRRDLSAVLLGATAAAAGVWAIIALLGPAISAFVNAPEVGVILPWLGLAILMAPLQAIYEAHALERLAFPALAQRTMLASLAGAAGALIALFAGLGLWTLVVQRLLISAVGLGFLIVMIRWTPVLALGRGAGAGVARPFAKLWLSQMINFASGRAVDLIIGLKLGTGALGIYRVAMRMVETVQSLATRPLTSTFLPLLARHPPGSEPQQAQYRHIVSLAALLGAPALAGLGLVAPELTSVLLDERYSGAGVVLGLLAVAGLVAPLSYFRGVALTAALRPGAAAWLAAAELASLIVWVWIGASLGLGWAVAGVAVSSVLLALISAATVARVLNLQLASLLAALAPPYLACLSMAAAVVLARALLQAELPPLPRLPCLAAVGAGAFVAHMLLFHRPWLQARVDYLRGFKRASAAPSAPPHKDHLVLTEPNLSPPPKKAPSGLAPSAAPPQITWPLEAPPAELIDPGAADRLDIVVTWRGREVTRTQAPALGAIAPAELAPVVARAVRHAPLARTVKSLQAWRSAAYWTAAARRAGDVRGLGLRRGLLDRRWWRDVGRNHLKAALVTGLAPRGPEAAGEAASPHAQARRSIEAKALAEFPNVAPAAPAPAGDLPARDPGDVASAEAWDRFFASGEDPWNYGVSAYEKVKYQQTLDLVPEPGPARALELGCAEGLFTQMLCGRVGRLVATDISEVAIERAQARCTGAANVEFRKLDFIRDEIAGAFELIVCSEALYYAGSRAKLRGAIRKIAAALTADGVFLTANANQVADEPDHSGFDWGEEFGSRTIRDELSAAGLHLAHEIETPLYRVHAFRKTKPAEAMRETRPLEVELEPRVAASALWRGGVSRVKALHTERTSKVPILMYHRVAPDGPKVLDRFRVTPERFAEHVELLRSSGFRSVGLEELLAAREAGKPLPGRPILITFDDGYCDFEDHAWPVLKRREFGALVFVVPDRVGGAADWDRAYGEPAPLLGWDRLRALAAEGVEVGSHTSTHVKLTEVSTREVYRQALRSRAAIAAELGSAPASICYPHGDYDPVVEAAALECGYRLGFSCSQGISTLAEDSLALSRIEVAGDDDAGALAVKLQLHPGPARP